MSDPWTDRLSDHIDGLLSAAEERELQEHLNQCDECSSIVAELRAVVAAAQAAPSLAPPRDLWPHIEAGIARGADAAPVVSLRPSSARGPGRRFTFSAPQLAAAAVLLMALSGAGVWLVRGTADAPITASGTIVQSAGGPARSARTVSEPPEPAFTNELEDLETALAENRAQLDPATVEVIERSLESIDRAIADARTALDADPGNPYLHRQLDNTMRKKVDILRRATRVQRADS